MTGRIRSGLVFLAAMVAVLVLGGSAAAHTSSVQWRTLTAGSDTSMRTATYNHGNWTLKMDAWFGKVTRTTAYLNYVKFTTCPTSVPHISGGFMWAYNSNASYKKNADVGRTYYNCGTQTVQVDKKFTGGYAGGNVAITVEKHNTSSYCAPEACDMHNSRAVFYVAP